MTKEQIAIEIFLRRMPGERYSEASKQGFVAAAKAAIEIAEMFMGELYGNAHALVQAKRTENCVYLLGEEEFDNKVSRCTCNFIGPDTGRCARHSPAQRDDKDA